MRYILILLNLLVYLPFAICNSSYNKNNLLSLISSNWNFRSYTSLGLSAPKCTIISSHHSRSPYITLYGLTRNYTAVLTGYNLDDDKAVPRANKGILYGLNFRVKPSLSGKARFLFHSDLSFPKIKRGRGDEFCCHIYSPPLKITETFKNILGTRYDDPVRDFGSDEKLDLLIRKENRNSRKITSCCFIIN